MTITLRPYQIEARDATLSAWQSGDSSVIGVAATGLGKTEILLSVLAAERASGNLSRAVILAHRKELIEQPRDRIARNWSDQLPVPGVVMGGQNDASAEIVCATVQTLSRERRMRDVLQHGAISHLIIDEAHHAAADGYGAVVDAVSYTHLPAPLPACRLWRKTASGERTSHPPSCSRLSQAQSASKR